MTATQAAEADLIDDDPESTTATEPALTRISALKARWKTVTVLAVLIAAAVLAVVLYATAYRPARQTDSVAIQNAIDAASSGAITLLSYAPDTLDRDMARAREVMTGDFLTYYGKFSSDVVAPAVREKGIRASAQVVDSALMEIAPNTAKVLVFLNQETLSRDRPEPARTASSVVVSVSNIDGRWLISALDPV